MTTEMTREELFNEIWSRPMTKVAHDLGISDVALGKICDRHRIPRPGRGYWAKVAAGGNPRKAHFRKIDDPTLNQVIFHGSPTRNLPEPVREAMNPATTSNGQSSAFPRSTGDEAEHHPFIARTISRLEKAKASESGLLSATGRHCFSVSVGRGSIERISGLLGNVVSLAVGAGYQLVEHEDGATFIVDHETVRLKVFEELDRFPHILTRTEEAELRDWELEYGDRVHNRDDICRIFRPRIPEWDYSPSGRLRIVLNEGEHLYSGLRRTFGDGKKQRVEDLIGKVLEAFRIWAVAIKERRADDERRRLAWAEEARLRDEQQVLDGLERKRVEALFELCARRQRHLEILELVASVEARIGELDAEHRGAANEWLGWARAYACRLDPLKDDPPRLLKVGDFSAWELRHA
ncbi:MAG: hypothetical protein JJ855_00275 [Rhodospirillales bacterium]|nr:hypothetical protein [Rhodospirillales bacterium]